jgi:hypothetical protein
VPISDKITSNWATCLTPKTVSPRPFYIPNKSSIPIKYGPEWAPEPIWTFWPREKSLCLFRESNHDPSTTYQHNAMTVTTALTAFPVDRRTLPKCRIQIITHLQFRRDSLKNSYFQLHNSCYFCTIKILHEKTQRNYKHSIVEYYTPHSYRLSCPKVTNVANLLRGSQL